MHMIEGGVAALFPGLIQALTAALQGGAVEVYLDLAGVAIPFHNIATKLIDNFHPQVVRLCDGVI